MTGKTVVHGVAVAALVLAAVARPAAQAKLRLTPFFDFTAPMRLSTTFETAQADRGSRTGGV
jgi:hypothetical protein